MQQAEDFLAESDALSRLLEPLSDADLAQPTAFKGWTIDNVVAHLHVWNRAAYLSLRDEGEFREFYAKAAPYVDSCRLPEFETSWLQGLRGRALQQAWWDACGEIAARFAATDPSRRVAWAGPSMSARSSITARLMETWAHAQAVYDLLGVVRASGDRIRNIVVLGVNTYGWTFRNRGQAVPEPAPFVRLTAPSGQVWVYGEESARERVEGSAEEFCQVVTQTRNVADTSLSTTGPNAAAWMRQAQCFAGPPQDPPAPGTRRRSLTGS